MSFRLWLLRTTNLVKDRIRHQQMCKVCGRAQKEVDFCFGSKEWTAIVPDRFSKRAVCLHCFEGFAAKQGRPIVKIFLVEGP